MRVLLTGGSSALGARALSCLLADERYTQVWCGLHKRDVPVSHQKLRRVNLRLEDETVLGEIPPPIDLTIHFAGITHARDERRYWSVNHLGTLRLAEQVRRLGCRRFVYISTRCATDGSGAYGESKRAAEEDLQKLDWDSLLIVRPAEVYGGGGEEGIDKFLRWAESFHLVPLLWGHEGIRFAPLLIGDFSAALCALVAEERRGLQFIELCGPENLSGAALACRIARRYRAVPIPLWWPALAFALRTLNRFGLPPTAPDQLARLVADKTADRSTPDLSLDRPLARFLHD